MIPLDPEVEVIFYVILAFIVVCLGFILWLIGRNPYPDEPDVPKTSSDYYSSDEEYDPERIRDPNITKH